MLPPPSAAPAQAAGEPDQNRQAEKSDFLARTGRENDDHVSGRLVHPASPYEVKAGSIIPATLITGINSDLPGLVVGQVRENVYDTVTGEHLLIPQGSRLLARFDSSVAYAQERVLLCWNRLIRPDGSSLDLECAPGVDLAGRSGFADEVDNHWGRVIGGVVLSSLLSAGAQAATGNVHGYQPTLPQLWASGAAAEVNAVGQQITRKNLAIQPTVKIRPGFGVNVLVSKDLTLAPYPGR
jgi:type IV secretion system protein VirB10